MAQFPNLSLINEDVIAGARVDGGLYGIPFQQSLARYGVLVRQDWLDRLGLEVPHTIEALGEVAQAFTERSEEHTSELQSRGQLVCRLLLQKKNMTLYRCKKR